uniref:Cell death abnormality protein 1 n=1 Tax=Ascaris suum TaxID=6253 RepID=F1L1E8_ASCSU
MGKQCDEYCHEGKWGPDCKYECTCQLSSSTCQATTGKCICNAGFMGENCDQLCAEGYYGIDCKEICNCSDRVCDPTMGCCEINDQFCGMTRSLYQKSELESKLPHASLAVGGLLLLSLLLVTLVFYYRRKYMHERDPDTPTITYYPQEKYSEVDRSGNEFDNPLYKQTAANKERLQRGSAFKENHSDDTTLNGYTSIEDSYDVPSGEHEATSSNCRQESNRNTKLLHI